MFGVANSKNVSIPKWVKAQLFEKILEDNVDNYKNIIKFIVKPCIPEGENFTTLILGVDIQVVLNDSSTKYVNFILKVESPNKSINTIIRIYDLFAVEKKMYEEILPAFESLYTDVGLEVNFFAKFYNLPCRKKHILMENLTMRGFKNVNRLEGLDIEHTKCALKKLAQWHAASAVLVAVKGPFDKQLISGIFQEKAKTILKIGYKRVSTSFLDCVKNYANYKDYEEEIKAVFTKTGEEIYRAIEPSPNEFNVLNHGDCWLNNIMFQYDDCGKIKETYFIDYQVPKYGSPVQDLYNILLSSTQYDIKMNHFDSFIKFYHDNLVENLKLLNYPNSIPSLTDLHAMLDKYSIWSYITLVGYLPIILLDETGNSQDGIKSKTKIFSNDRFRKHAEALLPWLKNRAVICHR